MADYGARYHERNRRRARMFAETNSDDPAGHVRSISGLTVTEIYEAVKPVMQDC